MSRARRQKHLSPVRLESFSDNVISVAITLLVLDLAVPVGISNTDELKSSLLNQGHKFLIFVLSFCLIGQAWSNHLYLFTHVKKIDYRVHLLNLLVLLSIVLTPLATKLLIEYINSSSNALRTTVLIVFGSNFSFGAIMFALMWHRLSTEPGLLSSGVDKKHIQMLNARWLRAPILMVLATALAPVNGYISLSIFTVLALFVLLPNPKIIIEDSTEKVVE